MRGITVSLVFDQGSNRVVELKRMIVLSISTSSLFKIIKIYLCLFNISKVNYIYILIRFRFMDGLNH